MTFSIQQRLFCISLLLVSWISSAGASDTPDTTPKHIIFMTSEEYDGNLGGLTGADALCTNAAKIAGSLIPANQKFKALLVTDGRYPCDASGACAGKHASSDWPLTPGTLYNNPDGTAFNTVNPNAVFDGANAVLQTESGAILKSAGFFLGIQSIQTNFSSDDIVAWAVVDVDPANDAKQFARYSPENCKNFTSNKETDTLSYGITAPGKPGSGYTHPVIKLPPNAWGNWFAFYDNNYGHLENVWSASQGFYCHKKAYHLVCVS